MKKLLIYIRLAIIDSIIYRGDMLLWAIGLMVAPTIYLLVWLAVIASGGRTPMSAAQFVQYYILTILVRMWANVWASQFIAADIRLGRITSFLIKPVPYIIYQFGGTTGNKILKSVFTIAVVIILSLLFGFTLPDKNLVTFLLFSVSWLFAGLILFLIDINIGLSAFWLDDISSIDELIDVLYGVFAGIVMPLTIYPQILQNLIIFLPFKYTVAFPIEIILGQVKGPQLLFQFLIELVWLVGLFVVYKILWREGTKKYQSYGN